MRFDIEVDTRGFLSQLERTNQDALDAAEEGLNDAVDELIRISSDITPFDKGILQREYTRKVHTTSTNMKGEVEFSVKEGDFNYALWTHEGVYNYGEGTLNRSGTTGWSGKHYTVGRKYLSRPLKGEENAFWEHVARKITNAVGD